MILTFGIAAPPLAWVGCVGVFIRWLTLSYLAERFENKLKERGEPQVKTDAQGVPFRCVLLVAFSSALFVGFTAIWHWARVLIGEDTDGGGKGTPIFLAVMVVSDCGE